MKKRVLIVVVCIIALILLVARLTSNKNKNILTELEGEIYYLKRDNHILKLYKSDANLKNTVLVYSHEGKSQGINDNISDFRYYPETQKIEIEAMYEGERSILELLPGSHEPQYLGKAEEIKIGENNVIHCIDVDYIYSNLNHSGVYGKSGSIYISIQGETKCILEYRGAPIDDGPFNKRFTGYYPHGLSPDGKYLVYGTTNDSLGLFAILGLKDYKNYIMNLETKEYTEYISAYGIQWVME